MRTILFRAKTFKNEWIYGDLIQYPRSAQIGRLNFCDEISFVKVKKNTVCQFTGLIDKNGLKIFEGDILDFGVLTKRTTVVTFEKGCFMHSTNVLCIGCDAMEVVGNIHDNPKLLQ